MKSLVLLGPRSPHLQADWILFDILPALTSCSIVLSSVSVYMYISAHLSVYPQFPPRNKIVKPTRQYLNVSFMNVGVLSAFFLSHPCTVNARHLGSVHYNCSVSTSESPTGLKPLKARITPWCPQKLTQVLVEGSGFCLTNMALNQLPNARACVSTSV